MANIQIKTNGPQTQSGMMTSLEPSRWIARMLGWDPFREMTPFLPEERLSLNPDFEVKETKDGYVFKADVPGIKESDLNVSLTGNRLTVTGKREAEKEDKGDTFYTYERSYGSFTRSFTLPDGVNMNALHADLRDGVLSIMLPKVPEAVAKKIPIAHASEQKKA